MILEISKAQELIVWLAERSIPIDIAAKILVCIEKGDSLAMAITKEYKGKSSQGPCDKICSDEWNIVLTP